MRARARRRSLVGVCGTIVLLAECVSAAPIVGGSAATDSRATISGRVRVLEGLTPPRNRTVRAIDVATGKRFTVSTNVTGAYTFLLPPGRYRLEFPLRRGEALATRPEVVEIGPGDIKTDVDFVLGPMGTNHAGACIDRPQEAS